MNRNRCGRRWAAALLVLLPCGCAYPPSSEPVSAIVQPAPRPALAAARDRQITLFGELPRRGEVPYAGRAGGSLLQHTFTREGADFDCRLDNGGDRFVFASTRHSLHPDLYIKSVSGRTVVQLTSDPSSDIQPVFSPDDQRVAFASNRTGNWDIWVMDVDGRRPVQVTNTPMDEVHPSWSSDGGRLVYSALPQTSGQWELWISPAEPSTTPSFIGYGVFPEWSPIDDTILFQRARQRGSRWFSIWTIQLKGGEPLYPTEITASADLAMILPSWSRDGQWIAYTTVSDTSENTSDFGGGYEVADIWVIDADGGSRVRLTDGYTGNFGPAWSPDGRLFFTSSRSGHENIWSAVPVLHTGPMQTSIGTLSANDTPGQAAVRPASSDGS
ncbi:MAG: PD40 domain-containing protein [Planctomycetes bacterium]|nr:PD40 domain-containing protein [Planctomycetota bacterium]